MPGHKLTKKQRFIAKMAPPFNKITGADFKKLRSQMPGNHKLTPKQLKIARVRPPRNKITGADLRALRNRRGKKK